MGFSFREHFRENLRDRKENKFKNMKLVIYLISCQLGLLVFFIGFSRYSIDADASIEMNSVSYTMGGRAGITRRGQFVKIATLQISLMSVLIGQYALFYSKEENQRNSRRKINLLLSFLGLEYSLVLRGTFKSLMSFPFFYSLFIDPHDVTESLFCISSSCLSHSTLPVSLSEFHLFLHNLIFIPMYTLNKFLLEEILLTVDSGSVISIYLFASVYGSILYYCLVFTRIQKFSNVEDEVEIEEEGKGVKASNLNSNFISMLGALLCLTSFPLINAITSENESEVFRSVINTLLSQCGSVTIVATLALLSTESPSFLLPGIHQMLL